MKFTAIALVALTVAASMAVSREVAFAQGASDQERTLKRDVEQKFDVLELREGVVLRPKRANAPVKSIEVTEGLIALDGKSATGAELRTALGADADLVLRVSYLDAAGRQRVFGTGGAPAAPPATAPPAAPAAPESPETSAAPERSDRQVARDAIREAIRGRRTGNDRVRFGGGINVEEGEVLAGDAVAFGGPVNIRGEVTGDAVAFGGPLILGPKSYVHGDAVVFGGRLERDPGARVDGSVVDTASFGGDNRGDGTRFAWFRRGWLPWGSGGSGFSALFALISTIARIIVLCALASLVLLLGHDYVARAGARASTEPVVSGAIGVLAQLLFIPLLVLTIIILVVTIIGIPLLILVPFAILALAVVGLVGFTAVASNLGHVVHERMHWVERNPYLTAIVGILLLLSPVVLARLLGLAGGILSPITGALRFVGFCAEYLAWTVGFGAVALLRFRRPPPTDTTTAAPVVA